MLEDNEIKMQQEIVRLRKELAEAASLLNALSAIAGHAEACNAGAYDKHYKAFPPSHPIWAGRPACNCLLRETGNFILKHYKL